MGTPYGRELRNLHCGPTGKPTLFATRRQPGPARLSGCLPFTAPDALSTHRRSGLPGRAVGGFSISKVFNHG